MNTLEQELSPLESSKRRDVIRHYEERFRHERIYEGKTDEEIIKELGNPKEIAAKILREEGYVSEEPFEDAHKEPQIWKAFWLVLFDVFVVAWFLPALIGIAFSLIGAIGSMFVSLWDAQTIGLDGLVSVLFFLGAGYLLFVLALWIFDRILAFVHWLIKAHVRAFALTIPKQVLQTLNTLRPRSFFLKRPGLSRLKGALQIFGVLLIVTSLALAFAGVGGFYFQSPTYEYVRLEDARVVEAEESWNIHVVSDIGAITFHTASNDNFHVEAYTPEDALYSVDFNEEDGTIRIENVLDRNWFHIFFFFDFFTPQPSIDVYVPENIQLENIEVSSVNGSVQMRNFTMDSIDVSTVNGGIDFRNLTVETTVDLKTTNGTIELYSLSADGYNLQTTNGGVELRDLNEPSLPGNALNVQTTNGKIALRNVYVSDVDLQTTNGSITYANDDQEFEVDRLRARTTRGSVSVDVSEKE